MKSIQSGDVKAVAGLVIRLLNKSLPHFVEIIEAFHLNSKVSLENFKPGDILSVKSKLCIFISILEPMTLASIVFTNVVRLCGVTGGAEEMALINEVIVSLLTHLKFAALSQDKDLPKGIVPI